MCSVEALWTYSHFAFRMKIESFLGKRKLKKDTSSHWRRKKKKKREENTWEGSINKLYNVSVDFIVMQSYSHYEFNIMKFIINIFLANHSLWRWSKNWSIGKKKIEAIQKTTNGVHIYKECDLQPPLQHQFWTEPRTKGTSLVIGHATRTKYWRF